MKAGKKQSCLFHLVGDIHQPMHAIGDARGGNGVPDVEFGNAICGLHPCELHSAWHSGLIRHTRLTEQHYVHRLEATITTDDLQASGGPKQWANESFHDAQTAWVDRMRTSIRITSAASCQSSTSALPLWD
jgi:hypothetical protein